MKDLKELKSAIDNEKKRMVQEGRIKPPQPTAPKDSILHELQSSLQTGVMSEGLKKIYDVDNKAQQKLQIEGKSNGVKPLTGNNFNSNKQPSQQQNNGSNQVNKNYSQNNRDREFDMAFQNTNKGLTDSLSDYEKKLMGESQQINYQQNPQMLNGNPSQLIAEHVQKFMNENFSAIVQNAMRDTIVEMYANDKMRNAIVENEEAIKKIVKNTLIELSNRNKKK